MMFLYKIRNVVNDKVYIGQSTQKTQQRLFEHRSKLRSNVHENIHLQRAWNKYGEDAFEFVVIQETSCLRELNDLEEQYIARYKSLNRKFGYNIRGGGNNRFLSEDTKKKISQSKLGVSIHTAESRKKISDAQTGKIHSVESRRKRSKKLKGIVWSESVINSWILGHRKGVPYPTLQAPNGQIYTLTNATQFAMEHNLSQQSISRLANGRVKQYKGWTVHEKV